MRRPPEPQVQPLFVAARDGFDSGWATVMADGARTGGALGLVETVIPYGDSTSLHVHRDEDEAFYVLDGAVDFVCGEERFRAERGALAYLPRGLPHTFLGVSEQPSRVLVMLLPGGLEEFFAQSDPARLSAILHDHHVEVVGPPLSA